MTTTTKPADQIMAHAPDGGGRRSPERPSDHKLFVIARRCGRLANRLNLFANFIAFAAEHGHRVVNTTFHSYAHFFETTRRDIYCRYPISARRSVFDVLPGVAPAIRKTRLFYHAIRALSRLNERFPLGGRRVITLRELPGQDITLLDDPAIQTRIAEAKVVFAYDWRFRAPTVLIERHAEKIRAFLRPIASFGSANRQVLTRLRQQANVVVGVHVRQGDYRTWRNGRCFFSVEQYVEWMRNLAAQLPGRRVAFFVCSDEPRTEREFPGLSVAIGQGPAVADLYTLADCDYLLGPLSTFSQWASFYGNKPLFHLRDRDACPELAQFRVSDLLEIP
jgi:hypothetical protein